MVSPLPAVLTVSKAMFKQRCRFQLNMKRSLKGKFILGFYEMNWNEFILAVQVTYKSALAMEVIPDPQMVVGRVDSLLVVGENIY